MTEIKTKNFVAKFFESILVIGYIVFEELIWNVFAKPIFQYFKTLVLLDSLKKTFLGMNRYLLLTVFITILAIAEGLGFLSGFCFINGYILSGIIVYACKIPIAAFTFWLFDLTKEQLMTFHWLKTAYQYIMDLIDTFINSSIHVYIKAKITTVRSKITAVKVKIKSLILQDFGKDGFLASVKSHYMVFKPYIATLLKR